MDRRTFFKGAGLAAVAGAAGGATLAAPAIAQSMPELRWRLTSSFPKSLDALYGVAGDFARMVGDVTDGKFRIQVFAAGEIVPPLQALDAASNNTVEMAQTASYYYWGKDPTFAFGTAIPFGLNSRMQNAWMYQGGGIDLMNEFYSRFNVYGLPSGNTGAQMGGWFRKEINTVQDLVGLKMRIAGFAGAVLSKLGAVPQQLAPGDIYTALDKGTIDATELTGPYDDERLGFEKVAKYYYYPGWWEGCGMVHTFVNLDAWNALPKTYQAAITAAAAYANIDMQTRYDADNPGALRTLVARGAELRPFSREILEACFDATNEVIAEISAENPTFKRVFENLKAFRGEEYLWFQLTDGTFDAFMFAQQRAGRLS